MEVACDSHALFWYLSKNPKLSQKASKALDQSPRIVVSTIVLLEIMYLLQKYGQGKKFNGVPYIRSRIRTPRFKLKISSAV